jgi:uncharacterized protein (PEP-CTERM system associated)
VGQQLARWRRGAAGARLKRAILALAVASVFVDTPAHAAKWTVTPSIRVQETYTNNVGLDESGEEEWDLITEAEPGVFVRGEGDRLNLSFDYRALGLFYIQDQDRNRVDHRFNGKATYEAVRDFFYVDVGGTMTQQFESPFGAVAVDSTNDTNNRYTASSYYVAPYIRGRVLGDSTYLVRNAHTWTNAGQSSVLSDAYTDQWTGRFATPIRTFGLGLTYDRSDTEYNDSPQELSTEVARAIGYWRIDPQFILNGRAGYEKVESLFSERSENIYGAGFQWFPTPRTSIEAFGEHRVFGTGYLFSLQHRRPLATYRLRASRDLSTYPQNLFTLQEGSTVDLLMNLPQFVDAAPNDLILREQLVKAYIQLAGLPDSINTAVPFYSQQIQIQTRQEASVALTGVRNTVVFSVYRVESENFSDDDTDAAVQLDALFGRHIDQRGANVSWTHRLSGRTRTNLSLYRTHVKEEQPFSRKSVQHTLRASINTAIGPKTNAYVGARYVVFDADEGGFHDYREAAVFVGFTHSF